jgi:isochorismate synthase
LNQIVKSGQCFAAWRLPSDVDFSVLITPKAEVVTSDDLNNKLGRKGFFVVPFDTDMHPMVWFSGHKVCRGAELELSDVAGSENNPIYLPDGFPVSASKDEYLKQLDAIVDEIRLGSVRKVILSRVQEEFIEHTELTKIYEALCIKYPTAYVFWYFSPETGMWMGASPEILLQWDGVDYTTVALAGTRKEAPADLVQAWEEKERDEQSIVTDYIDSILRNYSKDIEVLGPETVIAGQVSHLKTVFRFKADASALDVGRLLMELHPTPAVCGLPKFQARQVIETVEYHDRECYAGFIGYCSGQTFDFFVNIRTMKILGTKAALFLGGGITMGSNAEKEWAETCLKAETLLSVIKNVSTLRDE